MQIEHLEYLLAVVECGSMNQAAKKLYCTQPAVTSAIKSIENELGYPVIKRTKNGTVPTAYGKMVLRDASLILSYVNSWKKMAAVASEKRPVDVSVGGSIPNEILRIVVNMQKMNPHTSININYRQLFSANMAKGEMPAFRIGLFCRAPVSIPLSIKYAKRHGMSMAILKKSEMGVFINTNNELAKKDVLSIEDLRNKKIRLYNNVIGFPYADVLRSFECHIEAQEYKDLLMEMLILLKDGIAMRPMFTAKKNVYIEEGLVSVRRIGDCELPMHLCIMYPDTKHIWDSEKAFMDKVFETYKEHELLSLTEK